ncbi:MAG: hypothetical protein IT226_11035 [Flavobacteriales bacterium]|nr:hypothetical protein [Flavobacteriales bacterium]
MRAIHGSVPLLIFFHLGVVAQPTSHVFQHITTADGLSQNSVTAMVQDRHDFMWFGTQDGLDRFDGKRFITYRSTGRANSLANNYIWSLLEDDSGFLWIGTFGGGLHRFDPATGVFTHYAHGGEASRSLAGNRVIGLVEHPSGTIWVRTSRGLDRIDRATGTVTNIPGVRFTDGDLIGAMLPDGAGHLLLRTADGLARLTISTGSVEVILPGVMVTALFHADGTTYVLDNHHIWKYDNTKEAPQVMLDAGSISGADPRIGFQCVLVKDDHLWIGTTHGLVHRDGKGRVSIHRHDPADPRSLADDHVLSLLAGEGGEIWVGTRNGLDRIEQVEEVVHGLPHIAGDANALAHPSVTCLLDDGDHLWIGSPAGLSVQDRLSGSMRTYRHDPRQHASLSADYVLSLARNTSGAILVGTLGGGVNVVRGSGDALRFEQLGVRADVDPQRTRIIHGMCTARDGRTWLATGGAGLCVIDTSGKRIGHPPIISEALKHAYLFTVMEDAAGCLWMGSAGSGLMLYHPESGRSGMLRRSPEDMGSLSDDLVLCTYEDAAHRLWVGTANGLCVTKHPVDDSLRAAIIAGRQPEGIFTRYGSASGLPNEVIYGILPDGDHIWLSTNHGLAEFDPSAGQVVRTLSRADGLLSDEFNQNAYVRTENGELLFGGVNGLNWFTASELVSNTHIPPVRITRLLLKNELVPLRVDSSTSFGLDRAIHTTEELHLSWRDRVIGFEFAALNYIAPERNRYRYQLEGFDEEWVEAGTRNTVTYTNLDPGEYVLRVQGSNNDGVWNEEGASLVLSISTPPWRTWYAYVLYALVALSIGYGWYRYRLREATRELRMNLRIAEARSAEREDFRRKSAADFHDESGAKLTRINLHTGLAKQRAKSDPDLGGHLEHIDQAHRELSAGIRDLIWSMDPGRDTLHDVLDRLAAFALSLFDRTETRFKLEGRTNAMKDVKLDMDQRRAITLIMKEAMNNCAKHANAVHCVLVVSQVDDLIHLELKDDGKGFDPSQMKKDSYGTRTMPERAKSIGAELGIECAVGSGTVVKLTVRV